MNPRILFAAFFAILSFSLAVAPAAAVLPGPIVMVGALAGSDGHACTIDGSDITNFAQATMTLTIDTELGIGVVAASFPEGGDDCRNYRYVHGSGECSLYREWDHGYGYRGDVWYCMPDQPLGTPCVATVHDASHVNPSQQAPGTAPVTDHGLARIGSITHVGGVTRSDPSSGGVMCFRESGVHDGSSWVMTARGAVGAGHT